MKNITGFRLQESADPRAARTIKRDGTTVGFLCGTLFGFSAMLVLVGMGNNEKVTMIGGVVSAGLALLALRSFAKSSSS
jgi:hypothetical protein